MLYERYTNIHTNKQTNKHANKQNVRGKMSYDALSNKTCEKEKKRSLVETKEIAF